MLPVRSLLANNLPLQLKIICVQSPGNDRQIVPILKYDFEGPSAGIGVPKTYNHCGRALIYMVGFYVIQSNGNEWHQTLPYKYPKYQ
jgi:hypothetical protein